MCTAASPATDVLTLAGTFVAPVAGAYIGYTVPVPTTDGVYGTTAKLYAAAQTLAVPVGITATVTATAPTGTVTAGTAANWTLTASPSVSGTYALAVSADVNSPSGATATVPTTATFFNGTATVPVTLVSIASQQLVFTVSGALAATSNAATTPVAAAASSGYALTSGYTSSTACTSTTSTTDKTSWTGPAYSTSGTTATQSTPASTTPAGCYVTVVQGVDAYGNPVASGSVPVTFSPAAGTTNAAYIWTGTTSGTELGATPVSVTLGASGQAQIETVVHTNPATGAGDTFVAGPAGSPGITTTITDGGV
jgi:hypothetical protein